MQRERQTLETSVCRGGVVEEGKSVGRSRCPLLTRFRPVRWSRSSGTASTPTTSQRLIDYDYIAMPLHATQLPAIAQIQNHHIVGVIRTRHGVASSGSVCLSRADGMYALRQRRRRDSISDSIGPAAPARAGGSPLLRGTQVASSSGCRGLSHVARSARTRGRHQSAITHVSALNARCLQGPLVL